MPKTINKRPVRTRIDEYGPPVECTRCGHRWFPRVKHPVMCPNCKSPYWNRPRRRW